MSADSIVSPHEKNMEEVSKPFCPPAPQKAPWLVFFSHGKRRKTQTFFSIVEKRSYVRNLTEMHRKTCLTYSQGWLLMTDATEDLTLLNPITMEKILLPPIQLKKEFPDRYPCLSEDRYKFILSQEPSEQNCVVLFVGCYEPTIMFCHPRENKWKKMQYMIEEEGGLWDIITCRGKLYGRTYEDKLVVVDFDPNPVVKIVGGLSGPLSHLSTIRMRLRFVESCGSIFIVEKNYIACTRNILTFIVYKLDFDEKKWVQVHSIGDRAFFLCSSSSVSCSANDSGIRGNSIYYVLEEDPRLYRFDMAKSSISMNLPCPNLSTPWYEPHWIFL